MDAAATLTAIAKYESQFTPNAESKWPDPVRSYGPWQLAEERAKSATLTWQAKRALVLVRGSQVQCGELTQYASGHCHVAPLTAAVRSRLAYRIVHCDFPGVYVEKALPSLSKHAPFPPPASRPEPTIPEVPTRLFLGGPPDWRRV